MYGRASAIGRLINRTAGLRLHRPSAAMEQPRSGAANARGRRSGSSVRTGLDEQYPGQVCHDDDADSSTTLIGNEAVRPIVGGGELNELLLDGRKHQLCRRDAS